MQSGQQFKFSNRTAVASGGDMAVFDTFLEAVNNAGIVALSASSLNDVHSVPSSITGTSIPITVGTIAAVETMGRQFAILQVTGISVPFVTFSYKVQSIAGTTCF
jgi:hypothetical protein